MNDDALLKSYWQKFRDELLEERERTHPGTRPAAWWWFERDIEERMDQDEQRAYLEKNGLLTEEEKLKLAEWDAKREAMRQPTLH